MSYQQTIISAAKRIDILEYFTKFCISKDFENKFRFPMDAWVEVQNSRPNPIAPMIIHTPVIFHGPEEIVQDLIEKFRMRFLTAGG
jgi:hypothetical protein